MEEPQDKSPTERRSRYEAVGTYLACLHTEKEFPLPEFASLTEEGEGTCPAAAPWRHRLLSFFNS